MAHDVMEKTDRRTFLQASAMAAAATSLAPGLRAQQAAIHADADANVRMAALPRRPLGRTGVEITMLDQGIVMNVSFDRIIRFAFASGVRVFDSARAYGFDDCFKKWFEQDGSIRKQIFLVSKDGPKTASEVAPLVDDRLATLGTDWIDLFFIHSFGDHHSLDEAMDLVKSRELRQTVAALKEAGKIKLFGFSTHHRDRAQILQAAAEGGIVDAIMVQYTPWLEKDSRLNKALDACWKRGIGLISMKQVAGRFRGDAPRGNILEDVVRRVPMLAEKKLTPFQGLLHAIWSDERISSVCTSMRNTDQIRENADAARRFEPLKAAEIDDLRRAVLAHGPTLCADCDGRCARAAGTCAELGNLTRFLTYHEHLGDRAEARRQYDRLSPEARDWSGADLEAARATCPNRLDFTRLLPEVDRHLA
jgi:aryl-alcohol dehydrogenase-like predicted oxidoreductase